MGMSETLYLTSKEVADRWRLSDQTLANWRSVGKGPPFIRVGGRVLYPIEGIQSFEKLSPGWLASEDTIQPQS
jgi:predicted site-specific integrase-resolvase